MNTNNPARRDYTKKERLERACLRAAMHIRGLWEEKGSSDTRLLHGLFIPDKLVTIGRSRNLGNTSGHREHVVPRRVIIHECHAMLERGESDYAIGKLIQEHTKIVLISRAEQQRLDRMHELNLRQTMPVGWTFGDDIYARLRLASIQWDEIDGEIFSPIHDDSALNGSLLGEGA